MTRDDLYQEALEWREFELRQEGKTQTEAMRLSREQVKHDHDDGGE